MSKFSLAPSTEACECDSVISALTDIAVLQEQVNCAVAQYQQNLLAIELVRRFNLNADTLAIIKRFCPHVNLNHLAFDVVSGDLEDDWEETKSMLLKKLNHNLGQSERKIKAFHGLKNTVAGC